MTKQPFSVSSTGELYTAGPITSHQGISSFDSVTTTKITAASLQVDDAKMIKSMTVMGSLNVTSGMTTRGTLHAGNAEIKNLDVAELAKTKRLTVTSDIVAEGKITSNGGFHSKDGAITTKDFEVKGRAEINDAEFRGDVTMQKKMAAREVDIGRLSISNKLEIPSTASVLLDGDISCQGKASFSKINVHHLELVPFSNNEPTIDGSKGILTAGQIKANKNVTTGTVVTNDLQTKSIDISGNAQVRTINANSLGAKTIDADKLVANTTQVKLLTVSEKLTMTNADLSDTLSAKSIDVDSIAVNDLQSTSQISTRRMIVDENIHVHGVINASSIIVGDLSIGMQFRANPKNPREQVPISHFGCIEVSSNDVGIACGLSVTDNATIGDTLSAKSIHAKEINSNVIVAESMDAGELTSRSINVTTGKIYANGGFDSDGDLHVNDVLATGAVSAPQIQAKLINAANATVDSLDIKAGLEVMSNSSFVGNTYFHGNAFYHAAVNFTRNVSAHKLNVELLKVEEALEVGAGIFAKRVYTQDISASGFITAPSFIAKGDIDATGSIKAFEVKADRLNTKQLEVANDLQCSTARVSGILETGSVSAHKVSVNTDLLVGDSNILELIKQLQTRVTLLENELQAIRAKDGQK
jgi:hypothetical protein